MVLQNGGRKTGKSCISKKLKKGGTQMDSKFLGVGLTNVIGIALFTMLVSVILKVIFTKYEVEGISQVVRTA